MLGACGASNKVNTYTGATMGTTYAVKVVGDSDISQQKIEDRLKQINQIFSNWDTHSELFSLNQQPIGQWITVSDELFYVLKKSKEIYRQTNGYFDPGIGNLLDIWGFSANKQTQKPNQIEVRNALKNSSIRYLMLKDGHQKAVRKIRNIRLDLSAIAKGYGVDEVAKLLNSKNYLVEIGGEVRSAGNNNGKVWTVGIEQPNNATPISTPLNNQAIATSGNYRNYFIWQGKRYMHILNPRNGLPTDSDLASVSVIHPSAMMADAYATAMMAMGNKNATVLAKQFNLSAILILSQQGEVKVRRIN